ncbi:MAG TPA: ABC transporter permease [Acidimicrobiales bacterium]|nr:ABC transporter permease [Acidimicrobiales bacterium]
MTTTADEEDERQDAAGAMFPPSSRRATWAAFRALLLRDLTVLDHDLAEFLPNTLMQPVMLVFIFTFVFPRIGQGIGGSGNSGRFSTLLLGGLVAQSVIFQGLFRVALPLSREFDITNELEDRVLAPTSINTIAFEKIAAGALQSLFAGLIVFPVAAFLPATPIYLQAHWLVLATITPLACYTSAAIGLTIGTRLEPRLVPLLASFIALPLGFFGAIFYTWDALQPIPWLKYLVLINPLVYMSEGFRAGLSIGVVHMPVSVIYLALSSFAVLFTYLGVTGFKKRVLS